MKLVTQERYKQLSSVLTKEELSMFKPVISKTLEFNLSEPPVNADIEDIKEYTGEDIEDFSTYICWYGGYSTIVTFKEKTDLENFIKVISTL